MRRAGLIFTAIGAGAAVALTVVAFRWVKPRPALAGRTIAAAHGVAIEPRRPSTSRGLAAQAAQHPASAARKIDWGAAFSASHDYAAFAQRAALAAYRGNGSAAWYVSRAVLACDLEVAQHHWRHSANARERADQQSWDERFPASARRMRRSYRDHKALCRGFFHPGPFSALPARKSGYFSFTYWLRQAYRDHNPQAEVQHVVAELPTPANPRRQLDRQQYLQARASLRAAVASANPQAVFQTGMLLSRGSPAEMRRGLAVALAGCDLGYDCSASNHEVFGDCAHIGTCPPGIAFSDFVRKAVGDTGYARVYAMARELLHAISRGDSATIARFVQIPPSYTCTSPQAPAPHCTKIPSPTASPGGAG